MSQSYHVCPKPEYGMLPSIIRDAAINGQESIVMSWLEEDGGDINASDRNNRTLVFLACEYNHPGLLKMLLKVPEVHLNQEAKLNENPSLVGKNLPLGIAVCKGYVDCVEALVSSPSSCRVDRKCSNPFIVMAAFRDRWQVVRMLLKNGWILEDHEACSLLNIAVKYDDDVQDIIRDVLDLHFPVGLPSSQHIFEVIYKENKWDETGIEAMFKREVLSSNDWAKRVLTVILLKRDWGRLEALLRIINDAVEINKDIADAVTGRMPEDVAELLLQEKMDDDVMNGALLVASIGGTSEEIVDMLFDRKYNYTNDVLSEALILACLNRRVEALPMLFRRRSFDQNTLRRAKEVAGHVHGLLLVDRALKRAAQEIICTGKEGVQDVEEKGSRRTAELLQ